MESNGEDNGNDEKSVKRIISVGAREVLPKNRKGNTIYVDISLRDDNKIITHAYSKKEFECLAFNPGADAGCFICYTDSIKNQPEDETSRSTAVSEDYNGFIGLLSERNNGTVDYNRLIQDATKLLSSVEGIYQAIEKSKK